MKRELLPKRTAANRKDRQRLILLGLAAIYEGLVYVLSLGYYTTDIRAWLLFEVFSED